MHQDSSVVLQAAKAAADQAQAANGGRVPPYPGLPCRVASSLKLSELGTSQQDISILQQPSGASAVLGYQPCTAWSA